MPDMTDRDHFAAAALTGLLASDNYTRTTTSAEHAAVAYELADAMLRERAKTNHDAAPAARAAPSESSVPLGKGLGTGDTQEPVAWAVAQPNGEFAVLAFNRQRADDYATASDRVVPLYRQPQPTLTDAEREAIRTVADAYAVRGSADGRESVNAATLRGLADKAESRAAWPLLTSKERDFLDTLRRSGHLLPHGVKIIDGLLERLGGGG